MSSTGPVVLGLDVGGTHSRAVVADLDGHVLARTAGPGANRWSSAEGGRAAVATTATAAVAEAGHSAVAAAVVGVAGWGAHDALADALTRGLATSAAEPAVHVVPDVVVNHAAGSPRARGTVLAAGTGAIAARVDDGAVVARSDGCGWLLGDEGSAVWIGIAAVRAVLRALDGRGPTTALRAPIVAALAGDLPPEATVDELRTALVEAGFERAPADLGRLAPATVGAASRGDPVAAAITAEAVDHLVTTVAAVVGQGAPGDLVLSGSLLLSPGAVRAGVVDGIRARWPDTSVVTGDDGAAGAAALAVRAVTGRPLTAAAHRRLCEADPQGS